MKLDGKYRFSLQFSDQTEENRRVGELLEGLGNRKSSLIVTAVNEYVLRNPERESRPISKRTGQIDCGTDEARVGICDGDSKEQELPDMDGVSQMVGNLDLFT